MQLDRESVHMKMHTKKKCLSFEVRVRVFLKDQHVKWCLSGLDTSRAHTQKVTEAHLENVRQGDCANIRPCPSPCFIWWFSDHGQPHVNDQHVRLLESVSNNQCRPKHKRSEGRVHHEKHRTCGKGLTWGLGWGGPVWILWFIFPSDSVYSDPVRIYEFLPNDFSGKLHHILSWYNHPRGS
jgi:hypothetical protein